jgi:hypothetical protein
MATQVLAAQISRVTANLKVITAGHSAAIHAVKLLPRLGAAQPISVIFSVDGTTFAECEIVLFDQAFENFGLYGEKKKDKKVY